MNNKGKLISSSVTSLYNSRDVFVHQEGIHHPKLRLTDLRLRPDKHDKKAKRGARSKPHAPRHGEFPDCRRRRRAPERALRPQFKNDGADQPADRIREERASRTRGSHNP